MLLKSDDSVLLVIDVQKKLWPLLANGPAMLDNCERLIKAANRLSLPVLVSEQYPEGLGTTVPPLADLLPASQQAVAKMTFSCAGEPRFMQQLGALDRQQVIICGMESHVCVLQTAFDLMEAGYLVFVAADATGSRSQENHGEGLWRMRRHGIEIVTTEMVLFEWLQRSGTPEFKDIQALIK